MKNMEISSDYLEKLAAYIDTNGTLLERLIDHTAAAAILLEAGRLAVPDQVSEKHLRKARETYSLAVEMIEDGGE